jgi:O-acetylhomoserine/O-acetylserine sulfhydrylase-like pyridoxal-dependent enzyme
MRRFSTERHGIEAEFVDISEAENAIKAVKKETKFIWI